MNRGTLALLIGCVCFPLLVGFVTLGGVAHSLFAWLLTLFVGFPVMLFALVLAFRRPETPPIRAISICGSGLLFIALIWTAQPLGEMLQRYEIDKAKNYPPRIEAALEAWHKEHGQYPDRLTLLDGVPCPPRLLVYSSKGNVCGFRCEDPSSLFAGWAYNRTSKTWSRESD
jgi:hypothetical protein